MFAFNNVADWRSRSTQSSLIKTQKLCALFDFVLSYQYPNGIAPMLSYAYDLWILNIQALIAFELKEGNCYWETSPKLFSWI